MPTKKPWVAGGVDDRSSDKELTYNGKHVELLRSFIDGTNKDGPYPKIWKGLLCGEESIELRLNADSELVIFCKGRFWENMSQPRFDLFGTSNTYDEIKDENDITLRTLANIPKKAR